MKSYGRGKSDRGVTRTTNIPSHALASSRPHPLGSGPGSRRDGATPARSEGASGVVGVEGNARRNSKNGSESKIGELLGDVGKLFGNVGELLGDVCWGGQKTYKRKTSERGERS